MNKRRWNSFNPNSRFLQWRSNHFTFARMVQVLSKTGRPCILFLRDLWIQHVRITMPGLGARFLSARIGDDHSPFPIAWIFWWLIGGVSGSIYIMSLQRPWMSTLELWMCFWRKQKSSFAPFRSKRNNSRAGSIWRFRAFSCLWTYCFSSHGQRGFSA